MAAHLPCRHRHGHAHTTRRAHPHSTIRTRHALRAHPELAHRTHRVTIHTATHPSHRRLSTPAVGARAERPGPTSGCGSMVIGWAAERRDEREAAYGVSTDIVGITSVGGTLRTASSTGSARPSSPTSVSPPSRPGSALPREHSSDQVAPPTRDLRRSRDTVSAFTPRSRASSGVGGAPSSGSTYPRRCGTSIPSGTVGRATRRSAGRHPPFSPRPRSRGALWEDRPGGPGGIRA